MFFLAGFIESWGRGIEKMNRECREHDIPPPEFDVSMSGLMVSFHANPEHIPDEERGEKVGENLGKSLGEKVGIKLTDNQVMILELLLNNPHMAAPDLAEKVGITKRSVEENLAKLKKLNLLRREGPARGGHWEVLK